jgi:hypothetical protein
LGLSTTTIYARKCTIRDITYQEEYEFLEREHLQGHSKSSVKLGLFHNDELVSVMSFSKPNASKGQSKREGTWELLRFCSSTNIVGGASKLLSHFVKKYDPLAIISFCDLRWGTGVVYSELGFEKTSTSKPGYWYFKGNKRVHRYGLRKRKDEPRDVTEYELRLSEGYHRIWDCGHSKWTWTKKPA